MFTYSSRIRRFQSNEFLHLQNTAETEPKVSKVFELYLFFESLSFIRLILNLLGKVQNMNVSMAEVRFTGIVNCCILTLLFTKF